MVKGVLVMLCDGDGLKCQQANLNLMMLVKENGKLYIQEQLRNDLKNYQIRNRSNWSTWKHDGLLTMEIKNLAKVLTN